MEQLTGSQFRPGNAADADHIAIWLADFEAALHTADRAGLASLFAQECNWRDLLAFTWKNTTRVGTDAIVDTLINAQPEIQAREFEVARNRTTPREVERAGVDVIEAIFGFETAVGRGHGVVRLLAAHPDTAWVLMTSLSELKRSEESITTPLQSNPEGSRHA